MSLADKLTSALRVRFEMKEVKRSFFTTVLRGKFRGLVLEATVHWLGKVDLRCEVELPLDLFRRPKGSPPTAERLSEVVFDDFALDQKLRIRAENPAGAIQIFKAPEVKEPLLAFFVDYPQANLRGTALEIRGLRPQEAEDVHTVLDRILAVGTVIGKRAWTLQEAHEAEQNRARRTGGD